MSTEHNNPYQPPKNFERFSADIRDAMLLANREAKYRSAGSIQTIHLLTAISSESSGLGGLLLRQHGITASLVRKQSGHLQTGGEWVTLFGKLPLSTKVKRVVDIAVSFAIVERHDCVGTGGILLAMITGDNQITDFLSSLGIEMESFESDLRRYLHRLMVEAPNETFILDSLDR